jgi:hypothetical protein
LQFLSAKKLFKIASTHRIGVDVGGDEGRRLGQRTTSGNQSYRHDKSFGFREFLLVPVKGEKLPGLQNKRRCDMQNTKAAMSSCESVRGGQPFGFIDHISQIADLDSESAAGPVSLKLSPKQSGLSRRDPFAKLGETQSVSQLILTQRRSGQSPALGAHPSDRTRRMHIVSVEGK